MRELVDAIRAAPDDDAPRLVYADWLQARGDPHGELIALQCALGGGDDERWLDVRWQRAKWLLHQHRTAWLPAHPRETEHAWFEFRRGFPDKLAIENRAFVALDLDALRRDVPLLRRLRLNQVPSSEPHASPASVIEHAAALRGSIDALELWDFDDVAPTDLRSLPPVRDLALTRCHFEPEHARALGAVAPGLRGLSIVEGRIGRAEPVALRDDGFDALAAHDWSRLAHLSLYPFRSRAGVDRFIARCSGLRALHLSAPALPDAVAALPELASLSVSLPSLLGVTRGPATALRRLRIKLDRWDGDVVSTLDRWLAPGGELAVTATPAGDDLAMWAATADLAEVPVFDHCRIGDAGAKALAASPLLARTALLDLGYNRIGDDGGEAIASADLAAVRGLSLGGNVGDRTLRALAANESARNLRVVFFHGSAITRPAAIAMLDAMPQLAVVNLPHAIQHDPDVTARRPSWRPPE